MKPNRQMLVQLDDVMKRTLLVLACLTAVSLAVMAADEKTKPDNTSINERDRSSETQTSGDQSNSSADLKITQAIRQALVKDSELSTTAKNIKIITDDGQVTLRGPVKNAQEKAKIDQLARSAAGGAKINDQLDVKGLKLTKPHTNKIQHHTNEGKIIIFLISIRYCNYTARPSELSSSSKHKVSRPQRFQC